MENNCEYLFGGEGGLLELVSLIYAAVDRPELWAHVMDGIAEATGSGCTCLIADSGQCAKGDLLALARADPAFLAAYAAHYASVNVLGDGCDRMFPDGTVRYSHIAVPDQAFERTEFYNDYFLPANYFYSFGLKIPIAKQKPAYLASLRAKAQGPYRAKEGLMLSTLMPHLRRALELHFQFSLLESGLRVSLEALPYGLVLLDAGGSCLLMNEAARCLLEGKDGLVLERSRITARARPEAASLRALILRAVCRDVRRTTNGSGAMLISRDAKRPLRVVVEPYLYQFPEAPGRVAATLTIHDPESSAGTRLEILQNLYRLTPAESRLASHLAEGHTLSEAAALNQVTRETVRSQLRSLFQKTGCNRQADLVRLLTALPVSQREHGEVRGSPGSS